ncbi:hypothetical protein FKW77_000770 [Venturia effusa]|uniref:DUF4419 domain-containing protein n=1 Tax=Venturia effusa TaxID=50376 RepID=A0A517LAA4_9PEZI|nr:hypothetical protein FKW77_000770 [Venturia effusa]
MPVTVKPSPELVGVNEDRTVSTASQLLFATSSAWRPTVPNLGYGRELPILQTSFAQPELGHPIIPQQNGFVHGILRAFQQDLHLVLRPDDVWLAIVTQFSQYVKGNPEELRKSFVAHEGNMELCIDIRPDSFWSVSMGKLAQGMTKLIQDNVVDPGLRDWLLPSFTTTTDNDTSVAAIVMMVAMQNYFRYNIRCGCGFPSVTLQGEKSDWEEILTRVRKLPKYGDQAEEWSVLLIPIVKSMINAFDEPDSEAVREFWLHACHAAGRYGSGHGIETLSGWLSAFCFWDARGKRNAAISEESLIKYGGEPKMRTRYVLNNIAYPVIGTMSIPSALVSLPVNIDEGGLKIKTTIVAGAMGMTPSRENTTVQPVSGWFLLKNNANGRD